MTKEEFRARWESDDSGGGIKFADLAECAKVWGITSKPRIQPMDRILYSVLVSAGVGNAESYNPENQEAE